MLNIRILTLFPNLYSEFLKTSIIGRSQEAGHLKISLFSLFNYAAPKERIDGPIVGHGSGMVIKPEVFERAMQDIPGKILRIFLSPHGQRLDQRVLAALYQRAVDDYQGNIMIAAVGRYEGLDERIEREYADVIISIGDYVLMGGDLPAMVLVESIARLEPHVIGKQASVKEDSFQDIYVDCPHYTKPDVWKGYVVPEILKSGNHKELEVWRKKESRKRTVYQHFEWIKNQSVPESERESLLEVIPPHYIVLMHNDVMLPNKIIGTSSVTSIDIHDIARSCKTYGIKKYFLVTKLKAQQDLVNMFLNFWQCGEGKDYNESRYNALKEVVCMAALEDVIENIRKIEGKEPIIIVTSSRREIPHDRMITYHEQKKAWESRRPILFVFGTAHGLAESVMEKADYRLIPLEGLNIFNFLSVRSAVAIILDRWLGINPRYYNK